MLNKMLMIVFVFPILLRVQFGFTDEGDSPTAAERTAVKELTSKGATIQIDGDFAVSSITLGSAFNNKVTDEDLNLLEAFTSLKSLTLTGAGVTDRGLKHLETLNDLRTLSLRGTSVTDEGIAALQQALPDCRILALGNRSFGAVGGSSSRNPSRPWATTLQSQISNTDVQTELKLSGEQIQKLQAILAPLDLNIGEFAQKLRAATTDEERRAIRDNWVAKQKSAADARSSADDEIRKLLSTDQLARLDQIVLQSRGVSALIDAQVVEQLNLSKEQLRLIAEALVSPASSRSRTSANQRIRAILTEEQQEKWNNLTGLEFPVPSPRFGTPRSPQPAGRSPLPGKTPKETAEYWFDQFDRDDDDQLTPQEWQRSRNIRRDFTNAGVDLAQPMARDEFVSHYLRIRHPDE